MNPFPPFKQLKSGSRIPAIGLGTFGSDKYSPDQVAEAVIGAAEVGYRHFDCAAVYGNEREVGGALRAIVGNGVAREDLWITSKLWNNRHGNPERACEESLADLGLDYLDLYLIHWPFPNYHAPGVDVSARDPHAKPYSHDAYMQTWRGLERLAKRGLVREIGTSNMTISKLAGVLRDAEIPPAANEMELHPHFQQPELFDFVVANGILPIGYSPLGSPSRPARDRTPEDTSDVDDPVILEIAERRGVSPAAVCIMWAVSRGQVAIPFSVKRHQYEESFAAACADPLSPEEMARIAGINRNCRLIKGQVFLWPGASGWEDLWD
ncbi:MAG: aldo/keto reductase [Chlorobia bacterium]|nr:aldo/keto reductase [Fimbriimonadaceae bacterium]